MIHVFLKSDLLSNILTTLHFLYSGPSAWDISFSRSYQRSFKSPGPHTPPLAKQVLRAVSHVSPLLHQHPLLALIHPAHVCKTHWCMVSFSPTLTQYNTSTNYKSIHSTLGCLTLLGPSPHLASPTSDPWIGSYHTPNDVSPGTLIDGHILLLQVSHGCTMLAGELSPSRHQIGNAFARHTTIGTV